MQSVSTVSIKGATTVRFTGQPHTNYTKPTESDEARHTRRTSGYGLIIGGLLGLLWTGWSAVHDLKTSALRSLKGEMPNVVRIVSQVFADDLAKFKEEFAAIEASHLPTIKRESGESIQGIKERARQLGQEVIRRQQQGKLSPESVRVLEVIKGMNPEEAKAFVQILSQESADPRKSMALAIEAMTQMAKRRAQTLEVTKEKLQPVIETVSTQVINDLATTATIKIGTGVGSLALMVLGVLLASGGIGGTIGARRQGR